MTGGSVGARWQKEMEGHLKDVRGLTSEAMKMTESGSDASDSALVRAQLAQAAAMAALALAVANGLGDAEDALSGVAQAIRDM